MYVNVFPRAAMRAWTGLLTADGKPAGKPDKYGNHGEPLKRVPYFKLRDALNKVHAYDHHFSPYHVVDTAGKVVNVPRLLQESYPHLAARGLKLQYVALVLDVDDEAAHKAERPTTPEWRADFDARVAALPAHLRDGLGYYHTRGGARVLWELEHYMSDPVVYMQLLRAMREESSKYGIPPDKKLLDWGRLYRCPRVSRPEMVEGVEVSVPINLPMHLEGLGPLRWRPERLSPARMGPTGRVLFVDGGEAGSGGLTAHSGVRTSTRAQSAGPFEDLDKVKQGFDLPGAISQGGRNQTVFAWCSQQRAMNISLETIHKYAHVLNKMRCKPPMEAAEVDAIVSSATSYAPGTTAQQEAAAKAAQAAETTRRP